MADTVVNFADETSCSHGAWELVGCHSLVRGAAEDARGGRNDSAWVWTSLYMTAARLSVGSARCGLHVA